MGSAGPHQRGGRAAPRGRGEPALRTSLAPGPGGWGQPRAGQAHGKCPGSVLVQASQEPGEGAHPNQRLGHYLGCHRGSGALWAPMENRVAGGVGSRTPLRPDDRRTEAAQVAQLTGCSPAWRAERRPLWPMPRPGLMDLPPRDGTKVPKSSSSRAFSRSQGSRQLCKPGNPPRGLLPAGHASWEEWGQAGRLQSSAGSARPHAPRPGSPRGPRCLPLPPIPSMLAKALRALIPAPRRLAWGDANLGEGQTEEDSRCGDR